MEKPEYVFKKTPQFQRAFKDLNPSQQDSANAAFKLFKANPFDPRLKTHKINRLTSLWGKTVYSVSIEGNLRAVFYIKGKEVISLDIGTHDIYK